MSNKNESNDWSCNRCLSELHSKTCNKCFQHFVTQNSTVKFCDDCDEINKNLGILVDVVREKGASCNQITEKVVRFT